MGIAEVLLEKGLVTADQLAEAVELRKSGGVRLDRGLIQLGHLDPESMLKVLSEQLSIPMVDLSNRKIDVETLRSLPAKLVYKKHLVPLERNNGSLTVATSDPYDLYAFDEVRLLTGLQVVPVLANESEMDKVIKTVYGVGGDT
ncbi:MAG TPA: type II/IV secretion system protein, partial [Phycisphaerae bacterium]|nr:type II/IV secretion system protein [Phycisphaerae bacterium]